MSTLQYAQHAIKHITEEEGAVDDQRLWALLRVVLGTTQYASKEDIVLKTAEMSDRMLQLRKEALLGPDKQA